MNFKVVEQLTKDNLAKFAIEPLEAGFGHTLGNALRRVLLTALSGSAITQIKIDGVAHQFSTIEGIAEDVIEIILNIKKIRVKINGENPVRLKLSVSGKGEIKAKDIEILGDGEIANPDGHIATLTTPRSKLNIQMVAEVGKGFSAAEERKISEIGSIPVDAVFSPVVVVNYTVEPTRVGRRTDFDKLNLEIQTDGIITPKEALEETAKILSAAFKQVYEPVAQEEELIQTSLVSDEVLKMTVEELDLPVRITNALRAIDINTVGDLTSVPRQTLLKAKNLGTKSISLISEKLSERGLTLSEA